MDENAQTDCLKCSVGDDVANMKPDGHGKFLCLECAYARLEAELKRSMDREYALDNNLRVLEAEIVELKKDAAPFQAQIDQRKTYRVMGEDDGQS